MIEIFHENMHSTSATQLAYDRIYHENGINHRDSFYLWILSLLNPQPGQVLLDISCGQGRLVNLARKQGQVALGTDFAYEGLHIGKLAANSAIFFDADGECLPLAAKSVDYITHIGSLEHYLNPARGAKEIGRILKPNGKAVILLPNAFGLLGNVKYVITHGEVFDDGQPIQRYATRATWEHLLIQGGLRINKLVPYGEIDFPRCWPDLLWLIGRPQKIIRGVLAKLTPVNLANHLVFICSPE